MCGRCRQAASSSAARGGARQSSKVLGGMPGCSKVLSGAVRVQWPVAGESWALVLKTLYILTLDNSMPYTGAVLRAPRFLLSGCLSQKALRARVLVNRDLPCNCFLYSSIFGAGVLSRTSFKSSTALQSVSPTPCRLKKNAHGCFNVKPYPKSPQKQASPAKPL